MKKILNLLIVTFFSLIIFNGTTLLVFAEANASLKVTPGGGYVSDLSSVITTAINLIFIVAVILAFGFLIFGGIQWITSGGDKGKTEEARNKITAAVVGLLILGASWAIINFTLKILGLGSFTEVMSDIKGFKSEDAGQKSSDENSQRRAGDLPMK